MLPARPAKAVLVAVVLIAALAIRIAYVETTQYHAINDAGTYNRLGSLIAQTGDYSTGSAPRSGAGGSRGPTAYFPPAYPYFIALVDLIDGHQAGGKTAIEPVRFAQTLTGTVTVGLIGLIALEAFGPEVGLVALVLAAIYGVLVELTGTLVSENLMVMFELGAVWTALRARRAAHPYGWIAATGVLTGLATLTHQNAILLLIPLAFAAHAVARPRLNRTHPRLRALTAPTILILTALLTISPWTIRNAVELHRFVPVSDEAGITLVGTYNPVSAANRLVPYKWRLYSHLPEDQQLMHTAADYSEPALGDKLQAQALSYIGAHPLSPLDVGWHNTLRMFELEGTYAWQASAKAMGLHESNARVGIDEFWVVCVLAAIGLATRLFRRAPRWLWGIPLLLALSVVLINMETPRFREPVDPFLLLLASCAIATGLEKLAPRFARTGRSASPAWSAGAAAGRLPTTGRDDPAPVLSRPRRR